MGSDTKDAGPRINMHSGLQTVGGVGITKSYLETELRTYILGSVGRRSHSWSIPGLTRTIEKQSN
jgi:hypothetical protein